MEEDIFQVLTSLDPSKAAGFDGIFPRLLKHCALPLCQPLHHLFSLSITQSYIPAEWRLHLIKLIFKSGDRSLVQITGLFPSSVFVPRLFSITFFILLKREYVSIGLDLCFINLPYSNYSYFKTPLLNPLEIPFKQILITWTFKKAFDSFPHNGLLLKL